MAADSEDLRDITKNDPAPGVNEQLLWQRFRAGDRQAFAQIYEQYARRLLSYGRKITSDNQRIEDAIQDLFIELWKSHENLSPTTSIRFYLFRALRNKLSRYRFDQPLSDGDSNESTIPESMLSLPFEAAWIAREEETAQVASLQQAINQLSKRQQEVIHLRYYQHFNSRQVAEMMGINEQSVRNLLHTALRSLKQTLIWFSILLINSLFP